MSDERLPQMPPMDADRYRRARDRVRRAYECARARSGIFRGTLVASVVATIAVWKLDPTSAPLALIALTVVAAAEWRGGAAGSGMRVGLGGGFLALLAPNAVLRPCCAAHAGLAAACDCGMMSSSCWMAGALIGLIVGVLLPRARQARHLESLAGGVLAAVSVAAVRCAGLFLGEALGLLGGIIVGVAIVGTVSAWLQPKTV
jgi:hypothetical protein